MNADQTGLVIKIKLYYFKDKKSVNISEFDAYQIREESVDFVLPKKYDYLRNYQFVIYKTNKRARTKQGMKIRRALAIIAKQTGSLVKYDEKTGLAFTRDFSYIFADRVRDEEEYNYHLTKFEGLNNPKVISLTTSNVCQYVELDNKAIYNYYKRLFQIPAWFKPFIKMRAFRAYSSMGFNFNSRRYNDSAKHSATDKFKHDFVKDGLDIYKIYFTLARVLDSKLDACGKGFPLSGLMYCVLDVDGKCDGNHLINELGICIKCLDDSNKKLEKTLQKTNVIPNFKLVKKLFSGTKGWHLHFEVDGKREVSENILRNVITNINSEEKLVDWFDGKEKEGIREFDTFRIMKVCSTVDATTACLVDEDIKRINVDDILCEPMAMNL